MKVFSFPLLACNAVKAQYTLPDLETLKQFMYSILRQTFSSREFLGANSHKIQL
jgi:hypothetical protein